MWLADYEDYVYGIFNSRKEAIALMEKHMKEQGECILTLKSDGDSIIFTVYNPKYEREYETRKYFITFFEINKNYGILEGY